MTKHGGDSASGKRKQGQIEASGLHDILDTMQRMHAESHAHFTAVSSHVAGVQPKVISMGTQITSMEREQVGTRSDVNNLLERVALLAAGGVNTGTSASFSDCASIATGSAPLEPKTRVSGQCVLGGVLSDTKQKTIQAETDKIATRFPDVSAFIAEAFTKERRGSPGYINRSCHNERTMWDVCKAWQAFTEEQTPLFPDTPAPDTIRKLWMGPVKNAVDQKRASMVNRARFILTKARRKTEEVEADYGRYRIMVGDGVAMGSLRGEQWLWHEQHIEPWNVAKSIKLDIAALRSEMLNPPGE